MKQNYLPLLRKPQFHNICLFKIRKQKKSMNGSIVAEQTMR